MPRGKRSREDSRFRRDSPRRYRDDNRDRRRSYRGGRRDRYDDSYDRRGRRRSYSDDYTDSSYDDSSYSDDYRRRRSPPRRVREDVKSERKVREVPKSPKVESPTKVVDARAARYDKDKQRLDRTAPRKETAPPSGKNQVGTVNTAVPFFLSAPKPPTVVRRRSPPRAHVQRELERLERETDHDTAGSPNTLALPVPPTADTAEDSVEGRKEEETTTKIDVPAYKNETVEERSASLLNYRDWLYKGLKAAPVPPQGSWENVDMKSFMATSDRPSLMRNSSLSVNYDLMGSDTVAPLTQYKLTTDRYTLTRKGETAETAGQPTREVNLLSEEERASFSQDEGKSERVMAFKQHFAFGKIHVKPPWHLHATPHENCEHPVYVDWLDNLEPLPTLKRQIELSKKAVADHKAK